MSPQIDPRGQRFAAALTSVSFVVALATAPGALAVGLLAVQAALFATAVALGVQRTPVAAAYRSFVRPRLGPPAHLEDAAPPRFAQGVGLVFTAAAMAGFLAGLHPVGYVATGFALVAALLNATVGLCLGCEVYLLGRRALARLPSTTRTTTRIPATGSRTTP